jgi:hypothetical protein
MTIEISIAGVVLLALIMAAPELLVRDLADDTLEEVKP